MAAQYFSAFNLLIVTFDKALQSGTSAQANWSARAGNTQLVPTTPGTITGFDVGFNVTTGIPDPGIDQVTYKASPPDVIGQNGLAALPFTDYPLTVV